VIRLLFVVQLADSCDQWRMALACRPLGGVMLVLESCEHVIGMILDNVVSDRASIDPALRTCFE
jgi:hypothetical protein